MCVYMGGGGVCVAKLSTPLNNGEKGDGKEVTVASMSSHVLEYGLWVSLNGSHQLCTLLMRKQVQRGEATCLRSHS